MKKLTLLLILISGTAWADQRVAAIIMGFANGFNQDQPYQAPAQVQENVTVYQQNIGSYHYSPMINASNTMGFERYDTYQNCNRYLRSQTTYDECVRVED